MKKLDIKLRSHFFIDPQFQFRFLAYSLGLAICFAITVYCANAYFFWNLNQIGSQMGFPEDHAYYQFIQDQKKQMNLIFMITTLSYSLVVVLLGILFSHKIAGPIYNLKKVFLALNAGRGIQRVQFRNSDFFQELASLVNNYLQQEATKKNKGE
jgi:hypothetical protein